MLARGITHASKQRAPLQVLLLPKRSLKHMNIRNLAVAAILSFVVFAPTRAIAEPQHLNGSDYLAASRCIAYADLPQLKADLYDVSSLREAVAQPRLSTLRGRAADEAFGIRVLSRDTQGDGGVAFLRRERDQACWSFQHNGLVQAGGGTAPAS